MSCDGGGGVRTLTRRTGVAVSAGGGASQARAPDGAARRVTRKGARGAPTVRGVGSSNEEGKGFRWPVPIAPATAVGRTSRRVGLPAVAAAIRRADSGEDA